MGLSLRRRKNTELERFQPALSFNDWLLESQFGYQGVNYSLPVAQQEAIGGNYASLSRLAFKGSSVVFACMLVRALLFSEARFQFRQIRNGRPGDLFGNPDLAPLEAPGPGMTTGDLLSRIIQHADISGNWFGTSRYGGVTSLRPDWVTIVAGNPNRDASIWDPETQVAGYSYQPGGPGSGEKPILFLPEEVAHFAPIPDPEARFRGMSWLTPVVREVMADKSMTEHKLLFFEQGATPQMVIKLDVPDLKKFKEWQEHYQADHEGFRNAYKTLFLGAGADATVVGADLKQLDFKVSQGAGETRIAAAAGVPPVIVGLSEGLQAATYSNYGQARRRFADGTMRPLWRNVAGSLARIITVPAGAELWYDDRDIPALQEDRKDADYSATVKAATISSYIISGFEPASVVAAVEANDNSRLVHTGLVSVQLFKPGGPPPTTPTPAPNGANGKRDDLLGDLLRLSEGNRKPVEIHNHLPENEPAHVHTTVEAPPPAEIHNHIDVQPAPVPDVRVDVAPAEVRVEAPPPAQITVPVTVEAAEPQHITMEAARAPDVNVNVEPAQVTVEAPEPSHITVEAARAPDVHVTVEPTTVEAAPAPDVHVDVHLPEPPRPRTAHAKRAEDGSLTVSYDDEENPDG